MAFIKKTQTKIVNANGAIKRLFPLNISRTLLSTKPTSNSTKHCNLPGTPQVACFATDQKNKMKHRPRKIEKNNESILNDQNPDPI